MRLFFIFYYIYAKSTNVSSFLSNLVQNCVSLACVTSLSATLFHSAVVGFTIVFSASCCSELTAIKLFETSL